MRWLTTFVAYVYTHSRVQFHPAAYALMYAIFFVALMTAGLFVMTMILEAFGGTGFALDHEINAIVFGPVIFGELVRGHVRTWLGYAPEAWCFPSIGIAGLAAGSVFGAAMSLRWGQPLWLEVPGWGMGVAALYLLLGWLMRQDARKRAGHASTRFTGWNLPSPSVSRSPAWWHSRVP